MPPAPSHENAQGAGSRTEPEHKVYTQGDGTRPGRVANRVVEQDPEGATRIEVRSLNTLDEYRACVALQKATWGEDFTEIVPLALLKVGQRIGGVSAGAFDGDGTLLGFVFGLTGVEDGGRLVHWSDMLAVQKRARNQGIGRRLKEFQRAKVRGQGVEVIYWTFDPLVARNAHLNLNRLGARVEEYVPDMYGSTDSPLHQGLGTDRFIVSWAVAARAEGEGESGSAPTVPGAVGSGGPEVEAATVINAGPTGSDVDLEPARRGAPLVRVRIPEDIQEVQVASLADAGAWRHGTRAAFTELMAMRYRVVGFQRDGAEGTCAYILSPPGGAAGDGGPA